MKDNFCSINVILDASGSMAPITNDTVGGFNKFLEDQKAEKGEAVLSLTIFNTEAKVVHDCVPINSVPPLNGKTYNCNGGTALFDAVGMTIDKVGEKLAAMKEEDRPSKVLFVIITDGEENSSCIMETTETTLQPIFDTTAWYGVASNIYPFVINTTSYKQLKYRLEKLKEMIDHQKAKYNWTFAFLGAQIDAFAAGGSLGISKGCTMQWNNNAAGSAAAYSAISGSTSTYRNAQNFCSTKDSFFNQNTKK
jgi:uncharacterized protein YegL